MWLYRRGILQAKAGRHRAAIDDYTAVLDMPDVPPNVLAMAQYNRALVYCAVADEAHAIHDLHAILGAPHAPEPVKIEARRRLLRMDRSSERTPVSAPPQSRS